ncbi:hypothetical protein AAHA92_22545 [Salvia divinorum]|uniref:Uncharacterized protein n=1 Tax=Salvia divinorum TaxID=28513 RepID=A0ABD1GRW3_SALDI
MTKRKGMVIGSQNKSPQLKNGALWRAATTSLQRTRPQKSSSRYFYKRPRKLERRSCEFNKKYFCNFNFNFFLLPKD